MQMQVLYRRPDGSFVIRLNGLPYHVTSEDPLHAIVAAAAEHLTLPPEPQPPTPPTARRVTGAGFLALFTPGEVAAIIGADPRLLVGAFTALAQNSVNLDSAETAALLDLAVALDALTAERRAQILANQLPV